MRFEAIRFEDDQDVEHENITVRAEFAWQLAWTVRLEASVPWYEYEADTYHDEGPGDPELAVAITPLPGLAFRAGLRMPFGDPSLDRFAGSGAEVVPLGSGVPEFSLGLSYAASIGAGLRVFDSFQMAWPWGERDEVPPPGVFLAARPARRVTNRLGAAWRAAEWLEPYVSFDVQWKEDTSDAFVAGDSGETLAWISAGVSLRGPSGITVDVSARLAHEMVTIGIGKQF